MKRNIKTMAIVAAAVWLQTAAFTGLAHAQQRNNRTLSSVLSGLAKAVEAEEQDNAIRRVFRDVLDREPTASEFRRYRHLMHEEHWSERDVRDDLGSRPDYRRHAQRRDMDPDQIVRRAYQDILNRDPEPAGLRNYRSQIIDHGWTEQDVREALRKSPEHSKLGRDSADRIVRRAYQDILGREADYNGLAGFRNQVLYHGWDEHDVREALKRSPEYRQKNAMTREKAEEIVKRAYRNVLHREADPAGMQGFVNQVLHEHFSEADIARELRNSEEYRNKHR